MALKSGLLALALVAGTLGLALPARAADIIDDWTKVAAPPAPKLEDITIDPKTTALLMLDFLKQNCGPEAACTGGLPNIAKLLTAARDKQMLVIYTMFPGPTTADILPPVAPNGKEPMIVSFLDKFQGTDLDDVLKKNGIKTVIAVGNASNGAVLFTASSAFFHHYQVIVPVDGMSSSAPFSDLSTVYTLEAAPVMGGKIKLTRLNMIKF
jgi:nicotinamidase-related amidase